MKKLALALCLLGTTVALSACESTGEGYVDTQPPYASERTAGGAKQQVQSAEPVFEKKVTK